MFFLRLWKFTLLHFHPNKPVIIAVFVHFFLKYGEDCVVIDSYICLSVLWLWFFPYKIDNVLKFTVSNIVCITFTRKV